MTIKNDVDRLFTVSNELTDEVVAERVRKLAREIDKEEHARAKSEAEIMATPEFRALYAPLIAQGVEPDGAKYAALRAYRDLQSKAW